jgi:metal-responsive CopG/Arc/MetJ family transcriptional regulator
MIFCLTHGLEEEMASQRISVRVPGGIARQLRERSRATGTRESQVVREALEEYLSKSDGQETAYDRAQKAGLIDCIRGGRKDVSTNKDLFKGFGKGK